jgi:predicted ATP-grasp superfamily ATP-dependent carboligase
MEVKWLKKPKSGATIISGFQGFGLVGTIATEFLIDHLNAKQIGRIEGSKIVPMIAVHKGKIIEPLSIFYDEKENIILIRSIVPLQNLEWEIADILMNICDSVKAKEFITIEGISGFGERINEKNIKSFFFSADAKKAKKLQSIGIEELNEGIILGVTASLLSRAKNGTFLFSEAYSELPDSRSAAKIIEVLDKYLDLKVDYKPLIAKAEGFESKIKEILVKGSDIMKQKNQKETSYVG